MPQYSFTIRLSDHEHRPSVVLCCKMLAPPSTMPAKLSES